LYEEVGRLASAFQKMDNGWHVRIDRNILPVIEQLALQEDRKPPEMIRRLVNEALRARGFQRPTPTADDGQNVAA
jgi:hypothetical protein